MTDEELIARLRDDSGDWLTDAAADRIEQLAVTNEALTKERDQHWDSLVHWRKQADDLTGQLAAARDDAKEAEAYAWELEKERQEARAAWEIETATVKRFAERHTRHLVMGAEARDRAERAEAKLAQAVELLTLCRDMFGEVASPSDPLSVMLNETLAEIKGESHDPL